MIAESWDDVKESTIDHCFKHARFRKENDEMGETKEFDALADVPLPDNVSRDDFYEIVICGEHDDEELIVMAKSAKKDSLGRRRVR